MYHEIRNLPQGLRYEHQAQYWVLAHLAECHYAECHLAESDHAECHLAEFLVLMTLEVLF